MTVLMMIGNTMDIEIKNAEVVMEMKVNQWGHLGGLKKYAGKIVKVVILE